MRLKSLERTRKGLTTLAVAVLVAAVSYGVSSVAVRHTLGFQLTSGSGFTITSGVYATYTAGACTGAATAPLTPGFTHCLELTVTNPLAVPIAVKSLTVTNVALAATTDTHTSCTPGISTFTTFTATDYSGTLPVPAHGTASVDRPLAFKTSSSTQTPCEGANLTFTFAGSATFSDSTTTTLAATANPSTVPVTFTATVEGNDPAVDPQLPGGQIDFYLCGAATTCSGATLLKSIPLATVGGTSVASMTTSTLRAGSVYLEAEYLGTGSNFTASSSPIFTQTVEVSTTGGGGSGGGGGGGGGTISPPSPSVTPPKGAATTVLTGNHTGNLTVAPGKSLFLDNANVKGNITVGKGSSLATTGGAIHGSVISTGGAVVSLIGTRITGSVSVAGSTTNAKLAGKATTVVHSTKRNDFTHICRTIIGGNLLFKGNALPIDLGGNRGCRGSIVHGSLTVTNNAAAVLIDGNVVTGNISVAANKGGTLIGNTAGVACTLGRNNPRIKGRGNKAKKGNTCNASR